MRPQQNPVNPSTPRQLMEIVKAMNLDSVKISEKEKIDRPRKSANPSMVVAANDTTIPESGRNNTLTSMAGAMRRKGMTEVAIAAALQAENQTRCSPPLDEDEVAAIAASVMRYPASDVDDLRKSLTDTGNADRFARRHAREVIYVPGQDWLIWNGLQWRRDGNGRIIEMAKQVARNIYQECIPLTDDGLRGAVAKHAKESHRAQRLKAMLDLARSCPQLVVPNSQLDAHDLLLGTANGVIDLTTGKLQPSRPEDRLTRHSPVAFDPAAQAPQFLAFLSQITGGDQSLMDYLQRVVGYSLTGSTSEQCLFFLYGFGANGKSTFLNLVQEMLGSELAKQTPSETLMVRRNASSSNDIARLQGVRVVCANEIEDGSLLAESFVKQLTGGDMLAARFLYGEFIEFQPKFKLFIAGNHMPAIRGRDEGIWRRIRLIPFDITIPPGQRDKHLQAKLRTELPGILNWAIQGCLAWQKTNLAEPKIIADAVKSYRQKMDLLGAWINDCCTIDHQSEWQVRQAYSSYAQWAEGGGYRPMSEGMFSRDLEVTFKKVKRKDANYFLGITGKPRLR